MRVKPNRRAFGLTRRQPRPGPGEAAVPTTPGGASAPASQAAIPSDWIYHDAGGMTVSWQGDWMSTTTMKSISVELCDYAPHNINLATAALRVALRNPSTGTITHELAPARLQTWVGRLCVHQTLSLGYSQQLWAVNVVFWGSEAPADRWGTDWAYNPYL